MRSTRIVLVGLTTASVLLGIGQAKAEQTPSLRSVGVNSAHFRQGPSTDKPILYTADRYYPVQVLSCKDGWCKTRDFEGDTAWVAQRLLSDQDAVVITVNRANVRKKPSTRSKVLFRVDWGEALKVTAEKDGWVAIEDIEGEKGWVFAELTWGMPSKTEKRSNDANEQSRDLAPDDAPSPDAER